MLSKPRYLSETERPLDSRYRSSRTGHPVAQRSAWGETWFRAGASTGGFPLEFMFTPCV